MVYSVMELFFIIITIKKSKSGKCLNILSNEKSLLIWFVSSALFVQCHLSWSRVHYTFLFFSLDNRIIHVHNIFVLPWKINLLGFNWLHLLLFFYWPGLPFLWQPMSLGSIWTPIRLNWCHHLLEGFICFCHRSSSENNIIL